MVPERRQLELILMASSRTFIGQCRFCDNEGHCGHDKEKWYHYECKEHHDISYWRENERDEVEKIAVIAHS